MKLIIIIGLSLIFIVPEIAFAEVSDKVPSILGLWVVGVGVGFLGFFSAKYRIWAGAIVGVVSIFLCISHYRVISDPFVGPAIVKEQGNLYILSIYGSMVMLIAPLIAGFLFNHSKHRKRT